MWLHEVDFHLAAASFAWGAALGMLIGGWWMGGRK